MTRNLLLCLLLGCSLQCAAAEPDQFRFHKDIERPNAKQESIVAVPLDADVYAATRDGFPDLRIFDAGGKETPFVLEKANEMRMHTVRATCQDRVVSLSDKNDRLEMVIELDSQTPRADSLVIATPLQNFERRVQIFGGNDGKTWMLLVDNGLVFDYSRYMNVSNREVRLPKNDGRWIRVVISGISDTKESPFLEMTRKYQGEKESERTEKTVLERRPFRIDRIEFFYDKTEKLSEYDRTQNYPVTISRVEENTKEKSTIVYVHTLREPLTELTLETSSRNFNRAAKVQVLAPATRGARLQWIDVANDQVSLIDFGSFHRKELSIAMPEQRHDEYRVVIRNDDSPPLKITGVQSRGHIYRAVFLAAGGESYRVAYGSKEIELPKYDVEMVLGALRHQGDHLNECRLGKQVAGVVAAPVVVPEPPESTLRRLLKNTVFMGSVIAALVAVLAWALYRAARRINEIPAD